MLKMTTADSKRFFFIPVHLSGTVIRENKLLFQTVLLSLAILFSGANLQGQTSKRQDEQDEPTLKQLIKQVREKNKSLPRLQFRYITLDRTNRENLNTCAGTYRYSPGHFISARSFGDYDVEEKHDPSFLLNFSCTDRKRSAMMSYFQRGPDQPDLFWTREVNAPKKPEKNRSRKQLLLRGDTHRLLEYNLYPRKLLYEGSVHQIQTAGDQQAHTRLQLTKQVDRVYQRTLEWSRKDQPVKVKQTLYLNPETNRFERLKTEFDRLEMYTIARVSSYQNVNDVPVPKTMTLTKTGSYGRKDVNKMRCYRFQTKPADQMSKPEWTRKINVTPLVRPDGTEENDDVNYSRRSKIRERMQKELITDDETIDDPLDLGEGSDGDKNASNYQNEIKVNAALRHIYQNSSPPKNIEEATPVLRKLFQFSLAARLKVNSDRRRTLLKNMEVKFPFTVVKRGFQFQDVVAPGYRPGRISAFLTRMKETADVQTNLQVLDSLCGPTLDHPYPEEESSLGSYALGFTCDPDNEDDDPSSGKHLKKWGEGEYPLPEDGRPRSDEIQGDSPTHRLFRARLLHCVFVNQSLDHEKEVDDEILTALRKLYRQLASRELLENDVIEFTWNAGIRAGSVIYRKRQTIKNVKLLLNYCMKLFDENRINKATDLAKVIREKMKKGEHELSVGEKVCGNSTSRFIGKTKFIDMIERLRKAEQHSLLRQLLFFVAEEKPKMLHTSSVLSDLTNSLFGRTAEKRYSLLRHIRNPKHLDPLVSDPSALLQIVYKKREKGLDPADYRFINVLARSNLDVSDEQAPKLRHLLKLSLCFAHKIQEEGTKGATVEDILDASMLPSSAHMLSEFYRERDKNPKAYILLAGASKVVDLTSGLLGSTGIDEKIEKLRNSVSPEQVVNTWLDNTKPDLDEDQKKKYRSLVRQLGAKELSTRKEAASKLRNAGWKCFPALRTGLNDGNAERQKRCKTLIFQISADNFSRRFRKRLRQFDRDKTASEGIPFDIFPERKK